MDGGVDGWIDSWMNKWTDRRTEGCMDVWWGCRCVERERDTACLGKCLTFCPACFHICKVGTRVIFCMWGCCIWASSGYAQSSLWVYAENWAFGNALGNRYGSWNLKELLEQLCPHAMPVLSLPWSLWHWVCIFEIEDKGVELYEGCFYFPKRREIVKLETDISAVVEIGLAYLGP